jgi:hypothetical protein
MWAPAKSGDFAQILHSVKRVGFKHDARKVHHTLLVGNTGSIQWDCPQPTPVGERFFQLCLSKKCYNDEDHLDDIFSIIFYKTQGEPVGKNKLSIRKAPKRVGKEKEEG